MRVLLVDGFPTDAASALVSATEQHLRAQGHEVETLPLATAGFDQYMSESERRAYHEADNLVTEPQRVAATLVRSVDGIVVCCPITAGTVAPIVKGWFERVFVPGVAFRLTDSGRIVPALDNLRRVAMITECPAAGVRSIHGRDGCGPSLTRALRMNGNLRCRASYGSVKPNESPDYGVARTLRRWATG